MNNVENKRNGEEKGSDGCPKFISTQKTLGACYRRCWPQFNIAVRPQQITKWQNGLGFDSKKLPLHPMYNDNGQYVWEECKAWFEKVIVPKYEKRMANAQAINDALPDHSFEDPDEKRRRIAAEREEYEFEQAKKQYVKRDIALSTGMAAVKKLHVMVKQEDERLLPLQRREKLLEIFKAENVSDELAEKMSMEFISWDLALGREMTDRREAAMAEAARLEIKA